MKDDEIALRIEAFDAANGGGVGWYKDKGAYHLYLLTTEAPIARLRPVVTSNEVRLGYWSHRRRWEDIDDMGGCILPLDQALDHIANNSVLLDLDLTENVQSRAEAWEQSCRSCVADPASGSPSTARHQSEPPQHGNSSPHQSPPEAACANPSIEVGPSMPASITSTNPESEITPGGDP